MNLQSPYGGADLAEVLEAAGAIKDGDPKSWHAAWTIQAERAERLADEAWAAGDRHSARRAYLRASNYTRASGYMNAGNGPNKPDPAQLAVCEKVNRLFRRAAHLSDIAQVHYLHIPFEKTKFPAHLYLPTASHRLPGKVPILIACGGADAVQEELYYMHPAVGPELGYAVLTFEGPGQGLSLRRDNLKMRPDWDNVIKQVIDFLESFSSTHLDLELDMSRIAVAGASLGGYFALRAATDPRIKACVALDPLYSMWDFATAHVSPTFLSAWSNGYLRNSFVDFVIGLNMRFAFQMFWEVSIAGTFFGLQSPALILQEFKKYTLDRADGTSRLADVCCPVMVSGASESLYLDANHHTNRVFSKLDKLSEKNGEKRLWMASTPGTGSLQAKMGAMQLVNQKTFGFLDEVFDVRRPELRLNE